MGFDYRKNLLRAACMENGDGFAIMPTGKVLNHPVAFGGSRGISGIREKVAQGTISCRTGTSRRLDNARSVLHHSNFPFLPNRALYYRPPCELSISRKYDHTLRSS